MRLTVLAIALTAAVLGSGAFPGLAQARSLTHATVSASSTTAKVYGALTITGRLTSRSGHAMAKRSVRLESRPTAGTVWTLVSAKKTNSTGRASWGVQPKDNRYYRLRFLGERKYRPTSSANKKITGHHYSIKFADEFSGAAVDANAWSTTMQWGDTAEGLLQRFSSSALNVTNGQLVITASRPDPVDPVFPYVSGALSSHGAGQYSFKYGYIETRAKIPRGMGLWPAVWLVGLDKSTSSEIDVLEARGQLPNTNLMSIHFNHDQDGRSYTSDDLTASFHTFAVDWAPDHVSWYRDGVERWRVTDPAEISHDVMYLIANMQLGGWGGTPTSDVVFPARFYVDYIRVYQHD